MNKTKRVAWKKHRVKRKKYEQKLKQQRTYPQAGRHAMLLASTPALDNYQRVPERSIDFALW